MVVRRAVEMKNLSLLHLSKQYASESRALTNTNVPQRISVTYFRLVARNRYARSSVRTCRHTHTLVKIFMFKFVKHLHSLQRRNDHLVLNAKAPLDRKRRKRKCKSSENASRMALRATKIHSCNCKGVQGLLRPQSQNPKNLRYGRTSGPRGRRRLASSHEICKQIANSQTTYGYDRPHARRRTGATQPLAV